ncbi:YOL125W [Saccharomyces arboricola H-6]|uniref:tRNA:m(4)X modification enzyme TRM13 n=1 Tax=Saccharomyces arboricola (strain H-6 / AS 2.3317 / CBS 10644) TaxID=1160507 RepID=J8LIE2_SACAR|nr:YOL125W [Saccharomyces arboricola H-6]
MSHDNSGPIVKKAKPSERLQCEYFMEKKKRRCGMTRSSQNLYCSEHFNLVKQATNSQIHNNTGAKTEKERKRIPCPLDVNHTVWEDQLNKHMKKCNKTKLSHLNDGKAYYVPGYNGGSEIASPPVKIDLTADDMIQSIQLLYKAFEEESMDELPFRQLNNELMSLKRYPQLSANTKHAVQQSSLIENLVAVGAFERAMSLSFIEFGCGRAEFSRYISLYVLTQLASSSEDQTNFNEFVLIDRAANRMKFDKKIRDDFSEIKSRPESKIINCPSITRAKIDIRDLKLDAILKSTPEDKSEYVCVSKHLCGVATDLTLRCISNSSILHGDNDDRSSSKLRAICIAMCCRHVCNHDDYVNRNYITSLLDKYKARDSVLTYKIFFRVLAKLCSWATCGRKLGTHVTDSVNVVESFKGAEPYTITIEERENIGLMARRVIDEGRLIYVKETFTGFNAELIKYVESDVSLENVTMLVYRK